VIAVGLTYYAYVPPELSDLPSGLLTHSSSHSKLDSFKGREVIIVGAGASALDLAALLYQTGANVQVVARDTSIRFQDPPKESQLSLFRRLRAPLTGIGRGWRLYLCANMPLIFRLIPEDFRIEKVRKILGPAPCWFTREQIVGKVPLNVGVTITQATAQDGRASLRLVDRVGNERFISADHVIAATGYKPDVSRLSFLDAGLLSDIRRVGNSPALSSNFESTVDNLYFVGVSAANTFGPLLRFAYGAGFAAPRLSKYLAKTAFRNSTKQYTQSRTDALIQSEQKASKAY
jgi:thioredoxin reductase